jgi:hypothetical protein
MSSQDTPPNRHRSKIKRTDSRRDRRSSSICLYGLAIVIVFGGIKLGCARRPKSAGLGLLTALGATLRLFWHIELAPVLEELQLLDIVVPSVDF